MSRSLALLAALAVAAPAGAATYAGKPVAPAAEAKIIARDIVWNRTADGYQGRTEESRPLVLCQSLAKKAGALSSFTVDGRAIAGAELDRCNAAAPAGTAAAIANAN